MLNDHSSPAEIREQFDVSKKAFKQALGRLYKSRRIRFTETGICMTSPNESTCE
jgi:predicted RNA-binding protein (virulence factor B family)